MLADVTGNYPPGTWDADPRAPWNEPDSWVGRACCECARFGQVVGSCGEVLESWCELDGERREVGPTRPACEWFEGREWA